MPLAGKFSEDTAELALLVPANEAIARRTLAPGFRRTMDDRRAEAVEVADRLAHALLVAGIGASDVAQRRVDNLLDARYVQ